MTNGERLVIHHRELLGIHDFEISHNEEGYDKPDKRVIHNLTRERANDLFYKIHLAVAQTLENEGY